MDPSPLVEPPTSKGSMSWLVPLKLHWNGYSSDELERRAYLRQMDAGVVVVFCFWYLLQAYAICTSMEAGVTTQSAVTALSFCVRGALALASAYVLAVHALEFPAPTESDAAYVVQERIGRWVYLTRHCITLQAWHQSLSLMALYDSSLEFLTHGVSVWIATLGWYVTVQYFVLVVPNAKFKEACQMWKERGVQFKEVGVAIHAPALFIAVADLVIAKDTAVLLETVSFVSTVALVVCYTIFYLGIITVNFNLTGEWPYGFMAAFGTSAKKWMGFIAVQIVVIMLFFIANASIFVMKTRVA